jgi:hypothetical protein
MKICPADGHKHKMSLILQIFIDHTFKIIVVVISESFYVLVSAVLNYFLPKSSTINLKNSSNL